MFDQSYDLVNTSDILFHASFLNSFWLHVKTLFSQINLTIFAYQRQNVYLWDYPMRVKMNLLLRFREQIFRPILGFETNLATNIKKVKISKGGCFWKKLKSESELHFHLWSLLLAIMALQCKYNIFTEKLSQRKEITSREYHQRSSKIRMCSPRSTTQSKNININNFFLINHFLWFTDPILFKT